MSRHFEPVDVVSSHVKGDSNEVEVHRWADAAEIPWRNGGGLTRELASSPGKDDFDWRISVADVTASGDFSTFVGVERTIIQVDGPDMTLTFGATNQKLVRYCPFVFDGEQAVSCQVPLGPTRDLNVMTRHACCRAAVEVIHLEPCSTWRAAGRRAQIFIPLDGPISVVGPDFRRLALGRFDLLRLPTHMSLQLRGSGPVARIEIQWV